MSWTAFLRISNKEILRGDTLYLQYCGLEVATYSGNRSAHPELPATLMQGKLNGGGFIPIMRAPKRGHTRVADGKQKSAGDNGNRTRLKPPPVHNITLTQLAFLLPSLAIVAWCFDRSSAISFAAGALISILPQAWFAFLVFGVGRRRPIQRAAHGAYAAHAGKFLLSAVGFALVFALMKPVNALAVFAGFGWMWALQSAGSAWLLRRGY